MQLRPHQEKALEALARHPKGQIIVPTGGGKTLIAIKDAIRRLNGVTDPTLVVVAPRILLACLLYTSPSPRDKRQSRMPSSA